MHTTADQIQAFAAYEAAHTLSFRLEELDDLDSEPIVGPVVYLPPSDSSQIETSPRRVADTISIANERAFEELDARRQERVRSLVGYFRNQLEWPERDRLADRLQYLTTPLDGEEDFIDPSSDSLRSFALFVERFKSMKYPNVTLTPSGNIRAHWQSSEGRYVALEFAGSGQARFVIFAPHPRRPERFIRVAGIAPADWILDRNNHDLSWILR